MSCRSSFANFPHRIHTPGMSHLEPQFLNIYDQVSLFLPNINASNNTVVWNYWNIPSIFLEYLEKDKLSKTYTPLHHSTEIPQGSSLGPLSLILFINVNDLCTRLMHIIPIPHFITGN